MPIAKPTVSKEVLEDIAKAEAMHDFILATMPGGFVSDTDVKILVAALFSLTLEHHGAILYLLKAGLRALSVQKRTIAFRSSREIGTIRCLRPLPSSFTSKLSKSISETRNPSASEMRHPVSSKNRMSRCSLR